MEKTRWGFVRETQKMADDAAKNGKECYTSLSDYLHAIFPDEEWIHDKQFGQHGGETYRIRPDYLCENLKLIVEFDGMPHYQDPAVIIKDRKNQEIYEAHGYRVIRVPYFIQLTNSVVEKMFGVTVDAALFPEDVASMSPEWKNTPANCCVAGLQRMAMDFMQYPHQYRANKYKLEEYDESLTVIRQFDDIVKALKNPLPHTDSEYLNHLLANACTGVRQITTKILNNKTLLKYYTISGNPKKEEELVEPNAGQRYVTYTDDEVEYIKTTLIRLYNEYTDNRDFVATWDEFVDTDMTISEFAGQDKRLDELIFVKAAKMGITAESIDLNDYHHRYKFTWGYHDKRKKRYHEKECLVGLTDVEYQYLLSLAINRNLDYSFEMVITEYPALAKKIMDSLHPAYGEVPGHASLAISMTEVDADIQMYIDSLVKIYGPLGKGLLSIERVSGRLPDISRHKGFY